MRQCSIWAYYSGEAQFWLDFSSQVYSNTVQAELGQNRGY
jgi:hypothetical protein